MRSAYKRRRSNSTALRAVICALVVMAVVATCERDPQHPLPATSTALAEPIIFENF